MTEPPRLPTTTEEWEILAHRWPKLPEHERERLEASMNRAQRKTFERTTAKLHEGRNHFAGKLTTREDVVQISGLFIERQVLPIAARLDAVERWIVYREQPWWTRAGVAVRMWWAGLLGWLEKHGITFYTLNTEGENAGADRSDDGAWGGSEGAADHTAGEVPEGPPGHRLHAGSQGGVAAGGGEPGAATHDRHSAAREGATQAPQAGREGRIEVVGR